MRCQYCRDNINISEKTCKNCLYDIKTYMIEEELLELLIYKYKPDLCCICLDEMYIASVLIKCKNCNNEFHFNCISKWTYLINNCPMCKILNPL